MMKGQNMYNNEIISETKTKELLKSISTNATGADSPISDLDYKSPFTKKSKISQKMLYSKNKSSNCGDNLTLKKNYSNYREESEFEVNFKNYFVSNFENMKLEDGQQESFGKSLEDDDKIFITKITNKKCNISNFQQIPIFRTLKQQSPKEVHFSSNTDSSVEENFNSKIIDYRRNRMNNLQKTSGYFATTNFDNYTSQQNNYQDSSCSSSEDEDEKNDIIFSVDKQLAKECTNLLKLKVYFLIPEKLYSIQNQDCSAKYIIKNKHAIQSVDIKCNKTDTISDLVPIIISEINQVFISKSYSIRVKKDAQSCTTIRSNKRSGYPDFDLPSKLNLI